MYRKSQLKLFSDQDSAERNLLSISKILDTPIDELNIEKMFLHNPDADQALNILERYVKVYKNEFTGKITSSIPYIKDLVRLFGHSEYYSDVLLRRNDIHKRLFSENGIETSFSVRGKNKYFIYTTENSLEKALHELRLYKEESFFKIGMRNITGKVSLENTIRDLSLLADFVIQNVLHLAKLSLKDKYKIEEDSFCIISVGKLGGMELNYSSDVDLLYIFNNNETNHNAQNSQDSFAYYSDLASRVTKTLSDNDGLLQMYRVDLRLRPNGEAGPIVRDVAGYIRYYERSGQTWERQMLIKARVCAGNGNTGDTFLERIRPWVYSQVHEISYIKEIYHVKMRSEQKFLDSVNIKLSPGGIRDIETICQTLQHLYGGGDSRLRGLGTLKSIKLLTNNGKLTSIESDTLIKAYVFFRNVEHALQYPLNRQNHTLPSQESKLAVLSRKLNFKEYKDFTEELEKYLKGIRNIFEDLFRTEVKDIKTELIFDANYVVKDQLKVMKELGFNELESSLKNIQYLFEGHPPDKFPESTKSKFMNIWNLIYHGINKTADMDITLNNLEKIIHSYNSPAIIYDLFAQQPDFLKLMILLAGNSTRMADLLSIHPELFDTIIQPEGDFDLDSLKNYFNSILITADNSGDTNKKSYVFVQKRMMSIYLWQFLGNKPISHVQKLLTDSADIVVKEIVEQLYFTNGLNIPLTLLALGKFGSGEMGFHSDVDLLFLLTPTSDNNYNSKDMDTASKFIHLFNKRISDQKSSIPLYITDYKIRPEGKNSPLISTLDDFNEYLINRALQWEITALTKIRAIWSSRNSLPNVENDIRNIIFNKGLRKDDLKDFIRIIDKTRKEKLTSDEFNLKWSKGGTADIEHICQLYQLRFSNEIHTLNDKRSTLSIIKLLYENDLLSSSEVKILTESYNFYRTLEQHLFMSANIENYTLPKDRVKKNYIAGIMGKSSAKEIDDLISIISDSVKSIISDLYINLKRSL